MVKIARKSGSFGAAFVVSAAKYKPLGAYQYGDIYTVLSLPETNTRRKILHVLRQSTGAARKD